MFKIVKIENEEELARWMDAYPDELSLQEDRTGVTLNIEIDAGGTISLWATDYDRLFDLINTVAKKVDPKISMKHGRDRVLENRSKITNTPVGNRINLNEPGMGYAITNYKKVDVLHDIKGIHYDA